MSKNQGIIVQPGKVAAIKDVPVPELRDDFILVKVKAVALNPTDWKHIAFVAPPGARAGCDYAGVVEAVGSAVTKPFKVGSRVCGFTHGGNSSDLESGAFSNYILAKGDVQIEIPDNISFEEAATLGVGISTVGQALYQSLKLPLPTEPAEKPFPVLIYGGSTATGGLAIQFAKLSGLTVVTTCSPRNFDYVKSIGADAVFDYNSPTCVEDIKAFTNNNLTYTLDCISEATSAKICVSAMKSGTYTNLLSISQAAVSAINPAVTCAATLAYTSIGESFEKFGTQFPASAADFTFAQTFWELARGLLAAGKLKVHRPAVDKFGGGWEGVLQGLEAMKKGEVSGEKFVFTV